jgi:hypothetical protein
LVVIPGGEAGDSDGVADDMTADGKAGDVEEAVVS